MKQFAIVLIALFWTCNVASAQSTFMKHKNLEIKMHNETVGIIEDVRIVPKNNSKISIHVDAKFESFAKKLDRILREKGNLGGCQQRFFWRGNTSLGRGGKNLKLSSRLAYEAWTCPRPIRLPFGGRIRIPRARVFGDVRSVHWTLFIRPARVDQIHFSARVDNIVGWPNWVERLFGLRVTENIAITLPDSCGTCMCSQIIDSVDPNFESVNFVIKGDGTLLVSAIFSIKKNFLTTILRCRS